MSSGSRRRRAVPILVTALLGGPTVPSLASHGLRITTDYPSIAVEPGGSAAFAIELRAPSQRRVGLNVSRVPRGWDAVLRS